MADPLGITASVVGIVVPALHATRLLLEDLQQLKDAPKTIKRLMEDVRSVETVLKLLQGVEDRDWKLLGAGVDEHSKTTISSCTRACGLFRADLQRWTRHSEDGKLVLRDRASVGFFKQGQIKDMSEQLSNCQLAINTVLSIATLYSSVRNSHITEEIKKTISTKQAEVNSAITTADKQLAVVEHKLEGFSVSSDDEEEAGATDGKNEALQQLEEELKAVKASQKLLGELLLKSQEEAVTKAAGKQDYSTTIRLGDQSSGFQAGIIHGGVSGISFGANQFQEQSLRLSAASGTAA
ncbi:hypothetical protein BP6252_09459 [Coleophoma cylindrospora]|uniref:Azaphilone pigments biosynthesis cluster protein L N-terminal domain-containing protein n=1 Tax=Coleophoma cylindrospora TaxID=1849047 RepID=A0A3D8R1Z7_9HELO|nr:hypothetical protein BP6252_09459 [Coleophoma cylindrospora]